jgi:fructokinase
MSIVSVGAVLWDVFDEVERIGGAPFNFSAHVRRLGHDIFFISAVGNDARGKRALEKARAFGLPERFIGRTDRAPTGWVSVFVDASGQPSYTIHRPAAYDFPTLRQEELDELRRNPPGWIYFGTLEQMSPQVSGLLEKLNAALPGARRLYDVNLRKDSYDPTLVRKLMAESTAVKLNEEEVETLLREFGEKSLPIGDFCRVYSEKYGWEAVLVTRGAKGSVIFLKGELREAPGYPVQIADTVGAGDAAAAAFVHGLESRWPAARIADFSNRLGALVASRNGAVPDWTMEELDALGR